jgi:chromosome segregation ATPase
MQHIDRHRAFPTFLSRIRERDRLELAESVSLIGSAVGSVVAGLSGQVLFAATPITLALWLNSLNRSRFGEQLRLEHQGAIADLHQVVTSIHSTLQTLPRSERIHEVENTLMRLSEATATLQQQRDRANSGNSNHEEIQHEFAIVRRGVMRLRDVTETRFSELQETLTHEVQTLRQELASPPSVPSPELATLKAELLTLSQSLADIQTQFQALTSPVTPDDTAVQTQLDELQSQIVKLQQQNREVVKPYLKHLNRAIQKLESDG